MYEREDHKLIWIKFIEGDENALSEMYKQHYLGLINYGRSIVEDRDFVNDCLMEMLVAFWDKRSTLPVVENVRSYLITSLRRTIFSELESAGKRNKKHTEAQLLAPDHQFSYEEYLLKLQSDADLKAKISKALKKLTVRQQELIKMKFFDDLSYDEIAAQCGITKRTSYNIIYDAITVLKQELGDDQNSAFVLNLHFAWLIFLTSPN